MKTRVKTGPPAPPEPEPEEIPGEDQPFLVPSDQASEDQVWIGVLLEVLGHRRRTEDPNPRVQYALDRIAIAAAERIGRICSSDQTDPSDSPQPAR